MKNREEIGIKGELLARDFLQKKGYRILYSNWRHKHAEIDLIAQDGEKIVFIEVKTRTNTAFGHAESFVDKAKRKKMQEAADAYIEQFNWPGELRFDVIAVEKNNQVMHFEDAFYNA